MNIGGLSDSLATLHAPPDECPRCHSASHIGHGLCLGCLLRAGTEDDEKLEPDEFDAALDAVAVVDTHWRLGNYEILEEIGRGGMGVIYRARQRHSRRIVALKRILSYHADSRDTLTRFRREAEAAASLDHPNILPIYEVGESDDGVPYFSMKYASGGSLQEVGPALRDDPREIVRLMAKVTRAVQYAHRQGILHRDLKPGNILLDGRGEPLVSDFGLAKWLDTSSDITRTLTIFGTPGFIAPEQAEGRATDLKPSADVYSLGAILFDLLAGRPPFLGEHALAVIRQAAERCAPKLRSLVRGLDKDLETICARCLEREPISRYHSAGDLADDLERWLEGRSIIARPVSPPIQIWRWSRRNRMLAGSLAASVILGTTAIGWRIQSRRLGITVTQETAAMHSVAVLPLLDLDTTLSDPNLALKVADALQPAMARLGPSRVNLVIKKEEGGTPISIVDIKEVSRTSRARAIISGTKRRIAGRNRIMLRLVNGETGEQLLSFPFEVGEVADVPAAIARQYAKSIYRVLDAPDLASNTLARDPGLRNKSTRELLQSARDLYYRYTLPDLDRSITCFERVLTLQPNSAVAHAYLASSLSGRSRYTSNGNILDRAESEAREAVRLASDSGEARHALAGVMYLKGNIKSAVQEALNTVESAGPDESIAAILGVSYANLGRPDRALAWYQVASHCESRPGEYDSLIGDCWSELGEDERAEASYRRASELHPDRPHGWVGTCHLHLLRGEFEQARTVYEQNHDQQRDHIYTRQIGAQTAFFSRHFTDAEKIYNELYANNPDGGDNFYDSTTYDSALARIAIVNGDSARAQALLDRSNAREALALKNAPGNGDANLHLAALASIRGDCPAAIRHLRAAVASGWVGYRPLAFDPRFDQLRDDPDFKMILDNLRSKVAGMRLSAEKYIKEQ